MTNISGLRSWWWRKQGLDGSLRGASPSAVLERTGWARSVGGVSPYLALFARAGLSREAVDAAVAAVEIHELPAARGCTYVVPACDFALALRVGQPYANGDWNTAAKLGVSQREVETLCGAIVSALGHEPLGPDELREAVGGAARSLGDAGKKRGLATTVPLALGVLQSDGQIRRLPTNGRLDQQRYRYTLWRPSPLAQFTLSADDAAVELARRYFRWIGPATAAEFRWFSGLGAKAAKVAVDTLGLETVDAVGRLLFPDEREAYERERSSPHPEYALLGSIDGLTLLRRDNAPLIDDADRGLLVHGDRSAAELGGLTDLPSHAIFDRGRLVGVWEYDPVSADIAWWPFVPRNPSLETAVAATERFVREDLGDARSFSLDSPRSRAPRIAAIRAAGAASSSRLKA